MNKKRLFIYITVGLALCVLMGSLAASAYIRNEISNKLIIQYQTQEGLVARQIAQTLQREAEQTEARLRLIAQLPEVMNGNTEVCNAELKKIFTDPQTKVGNLGRVGPDGIFRCSLNEKLIGIKAATLGPYITQIFDDPEHQSVMSRAIKPVGAPSYVVAIHVPVYGKDGAFIGTLGGAIYLNDIANLYLKDIQLAKGGYVALFDDDGTVLYHYRPELIGMNFASAEYQKFVKGGADPQTAIAEIKAGVSGTRRYSFDNDEKIAAYEPVKIFKGRNWRVLITIPLAAAQENINVTGIGPILVQLPMVLGALLLVLLPLFIWLMSRKVINPMEELEAQKTQFLSMASHQLRTPLGSMRWNLEYILAADLSALSTDLKERLSGVYDSNTRLIVLVRDLLNVARIEAGRTKSEPALTDMAPILESASHEMDAEATNRGVVIQKDIATLPKTFLDPQRLREATQNILSNAVKYTEKGGQVNLRAHVVGNAVVVEVQDTGAGIPKADQEKIFSKFYRAGNAVRLDPDGNGLGLYIVKSFVEEWGGTLSFVSKEGVGTTFTYTVPLPKK